MLSSRINELDFEELSRYRNNDGYIVLDGIIDSDGEDEIRGTTTKIKKWYDCKGGRVLVKSDNSDIQNGIYSELICCELAKQASLPTAMYDAVEYNGEKALISKNVCAGNEELISIHELIGDDAVHEDFPDKTDIYDIFDRLQTKFKEMGMTAEQVDTNITNLRKQLLFDICVMETDRHTENISYIFGTDEDGKQTIRLAPMYDTEAALALCERGVAEKISRDIGKTSEITDMQEPKICVLPENIEGEKSSEPKTAYDLFLAQLQQNVSSGYESESEEIWKSTLHFLCEDEQANIYLTNELNSMNISTAITSVEEKHRIKIPDYVKNMAINCFEDRKSSIAWEIGIEEVNNTDNYRDDVDITLD